MVDNKYDAIGAKEETMGDLLVVVQGWVNFWLLCKEGYIEVVQTAIEDGADVNEADFGGRTGLMWALKNSHNSVVQSLLHHPQTDFNKLDLKGCSALHWAVFGDNHEGMVALLAQNDQSINQKDRYGQTPIMNAVGWNAVNCFHLLLTNPLVDLDTKDYYERRPQEVLR